MEDEVLIAMNEVEMLERHGYAVISVSSAQKAIAAVTENLIDLILMDIDLGKNKMDGTEAAEIILQDRNIPVVFLSSHTEPEIVEKTEKITSYGYVVKNSGETVLIASIKMAFKLHEANNLVLERERLVAREKARLQQYLDVTQMLIVALDVNQRITLLNPKGCEILGYSEEEVLGLNWFDLVIPPDEAESVKTVFKKIITGEIASVEYYENNVLCKDGSEKLVAWHNSILKDDDGKIIGTLSSGEDVTQHRRLDEQIKTSNQMLRTAEQIAGIGSWILDLEKNMQSWSDNYFELLGYKKGEDVPSKELFIKRIHPEDRDMVVRTMETALKQKKNTDLEFRYNNGSDEYRWASSRANLTQNNDGDVIRVDGVFQDITDLRQKEAAILESEWKYSTLFSNMAQGAFYQRTDGSIIDCNDAVLEQFGLSKDQFLGRTSMHPDWRVVREDGTDLPGEEHPSMVALRTGKPVRNFVAGVFNPKRQEYVWLSISAIPQFRTDEEKPYQTFVTLHDITEKRRQETELSLTLEATTDGIWEWDFKTGDMFFSDRYYTMLGYEPGEFPACFESWRDLIHPDDLETALQTAEIYLETKPDKYENEFRMRTKSGEYRWIHTNARVVERDADGEAMRMIGNHADITDRKDKARDLLDTEKQFRDIYRKVPIMLHSIDGDGKIIDVSDRWLEELGYERDEVIGRLSTDFLTEESKVIARERALPDFFEKGHVVDFPYQFVKKNGEIIDVLLSAISETDEEGNFRRSIAVLNNVTEKNRLKWNFLALAENAGVGITVIRDDAVVYVNSTAAEIAGYSRDEMLKLGMAKMIDRIHSGDRTRVVGIYRKQLEDLKAGAWTESKYPPIEYRHVRVTGAIVWVQAHTSQFQYNGEPALLVIHTDVTERRKLENELRLNDARYKKAQAMGKVGNWEYNIQTDEFWGSEESKRIYGLDPESQAFSSEDVESCIPERKRVHQALIDLIERGAEYNLEFDIVTKDKKERKTIHSLAELERDEAGNPLKVNGVVMDITEQHQIEGKIKFQAKLLEAVDQAVITTDLKGNIIYFNRFAEELYGWDAEDAVGKDVLEVTVPEISQDQGREIMKAIARGESWEGEFTARRKDGSTFWAHVKDSPVFDEVGNLIGIVGISSDMSERAQKENRLKESNARFESFFNSNISATFVWEHRDGVFILTEVNDAAQKMTDNRAADFIGLKAGEIYGDLPLMKEKLEECYRNKSIIEFEYYYKNRNRGAYDWVNFRMAYLEPNGVILFADLITPRKETEEALRESESRRRSAQKLANVGYWDWYMETGELKWSEEVYHIFGQNPKSFSVTAENFEALIHPADLDAFIAEREKALAESRDVNIEHRIICPDGGIRWVHEIAEIIRDEGGEVVQVSGVVQDISSRKVMEEKLQTSLIDLRLAQKIAKIGNWQFDPEVGVPVWSEEIYTIYERDPAIGPPHIDEYKQIYGPDQYNTFMIAFSAAIQEGEPYDIQLQFKPAEDRVKWLHAICRPVAKKSEAGYFLRGTIQDITEIKKVEEQKDFLMRELNHRVKNNLMMISSLVDMKNRALGEVCDLSDISRQIDAIRIVHEKLYQSEGITQINLKDYFRDLLDTVFSFSKIPARVEEQVDNIPLPTKTAISLGLIVNEIATNAIKHGFREVSSPVFFIGFRKDDGRNRFVLTLGNNGAAFPTEIDLDNPATLGLKLVSGLVEQLEGAIELKRGPHPLFTIRFPREETGG